MGIRYGRSYIYSHIIRYGRSYILISPRKRNWRVSFLLRENPYWAFVLFYGLFSCYSYLSDSSRYKVDWRVSQPNTTIPPTILITRIPLQRCRITTFLQFVLFLSDWQRMFVTSTRFVWSTEKKWTLCHCSWQIQWFVVM